MSDARAPDGRFRAGRSGNPKGRPRKANTVGETVREALAAKVTITENGRRKRMSKREAAATQLANKSASGDLRANKLAFEMAQKAEERAAKLPPAAADISATDKESVARLIARLRLIDKELPDEQNHD